MNGGLWKRRVSLWELYEGTWTEGSFTGDPKDILSKALEMGVCFHWGPVLGNIGGRSFPRDFARRVEFLFY